MAQLVICGRALFSGLGERRFERLHVGAAGGRNAPATLARPLDQSIREKGDRK
jgi:hypothetical protein